MVSKIIRSGSEPFEAEFYSSLQFELRLVYLNKL